MGALNANTVNNKSHTEKFTYHKKHLPLILVWQQEKTEDGGVGNLVVECFTVQVKKCRVDTDVISEERKINWLTPNVNN